MNEANAILHTVKEIPMLYKRLFGFEIDFFDAIELLPIILRRTGSMAIKDFLFKGTIVNFELQLPANVYAIQHVCLSQPLSYYQGSLNQTEGYLINYRFDQTGNIGAFNGGITDAETIDSPSQSNVYEINKNVFSMPVGSLVDFVNDNNHCLNFNWKNREVDVLYSGSVFDTEGYLKLPEKTLEAVCYYLFYIEIRKKFYSKQADASMLALAKQEKDVAISRAKTPVAMSVNETDMIFNQWTSFNRKVHNSQMRKF